MSIEDREQLEQLIDEAAALYARLVRLPASPRRDRLVQRATRRSRRRMERLADLAQTEWRQRQGQKSDQRGATR